jgi:hypothetical protein
MIQGAMSQSTAILRAPRSATLDGFTRIAGDVDGVNVRALEPLTSVLVRTKNSTYQIDVRGGTAAIVQGGQFFPTPRAAEVCGATMGGSFIKVGWIGVGFCLELIADGQRIVTTRVSAIGIQPSAGGSRIH